MGTLSPLIARRLRTQRLVGEPFATAVQTVGWLGAVQSQDYAGAKWGLGQRTRGAVDAELDRQFDAGAFLRTHVMRPTWHFVLPEDARWLLELTAPRVRAIMAVYQRRLEIDGALIARSQKVLESVLGDGPALTRPELAAALGRAGIDTGGQRLGHLLMRAELDMIVISGPRRGKQHTYALFDLRAPRSRRLERDESLAELSRRYFTSHGPAQIQDFAWWSGLALRDARNGVELADEDLEHEVIDGKSHWSGTHPQSSRLQRPLVHLLPNYDEYLIAYRDRSALLHPSRPLDDAPFPYGSIIANVVVVDGQVWGGWKRLSSAKEVVVELGPLGRLDEPAVAALNKSAAAFGRFLGVPVTVSTGGR